METAIPAVTQADKARTIKGKAATPHPALAVTVLTMELALSKTMGTGKEDLVLAVVVEREKSDHTVVVAEEVTLVVEQVSMVVAAVAAPTIREPTKTTPPVQIPGMAK